MRIPDLRENSGKITAEHASVLLEKMGRLFQDIYGDEEIMKDVLEMDPVQMAEDLSSMLSHERFFKLFQYDLGRGMLIGLFVQRFLFRDDEDDSV